MQAGPRPVLQPVPVRHREKAAHCYGKLMSFCFETGSIMAIWWLQVDATSAGGDGYGWRGVGRPYVWTLKVEWGEDLMDAGGWEGGWVRF